jgi:hypothetical protein
MATLEDYLAGRPLIGREAKEFDKLGQALGTYGRSTDIAKALGASTDTNPAMGALDFLIDPEKGVLSAGARALRRPIFDALGYEGESTAGFGNLPGLKVEDDDSLLEKGAKMVGAFGLDVVTDPLSYLSAPTSLGRTAVAKTLAEQAPSVFKTLTKAGVKEDELITKLVNQDRRGILAAKDDAPKELVERLKNSDEREFIAKESLGNILAESLIKGGRRNVIKALEDLTGSPTAARAAFDELPSEFKGGLWLANPLTGTPKLRLSPGAGWMDTLGVGRVADAGNAARFTGARVGGKVVTKYLSGKAGATFQATKEGLKGVSGLPEADWQRTTFLDFTKYRDALTSGERYRTELQERFLPALLAARTGTEQFGEAEWNDALLKALTRPGDSTLQAQGELGRVAAERATSLRETVNKLAEEARQEGIEIGDLGEFWFPLMLTDEAAKKRKRQSVSGRMRTEYNSGKGRTAFVRYVDDPEGGALIGYSMGDPSNSLYAATPEVVNKEFFGGAKEFIEDPVQAFGKYMDQLTGRMVIKRLENTLVREGVLVRDVPATVKRINDLAAASMASVGLKAGAAAAKAADAAAERARAEMGDVIGGQAAVVQQVEQARAQARTVYNGAKKTEADARKAVSEAKWVEANSRLKPSEVQSMLADYGRAGLEGEIAEIGRKVAKAKRDIDAWDRRTATAAKKKGEANAGSDAELARAQEEAQEIYDSLVLTEAELQSLRDAQTAARRWKATVQASLADDTVKAADEWVASLKSLEDAQASLRQARDVRVASKRNLDTLEQSRKIEQLDALDAVVGNYVNAQLALKKAVANKAPAAEIAVLRQAAVEAKKTFDVATGQREKLEGPAREYADAVKRAVDTLTEAEFSVFTVMTSNKTIGDVIEMISARSANSEIEGAALSDFVDAFKVIRSKLSKKDFEALSNLEQRVLLDEKVEPSAFGLMLSESEDGLLPIGGKFKDTYGPVSVQKSLEQIFELSQRPAEWQKKIEDYVDPLQMLWRLTATQLRGPAYTVLNLMGGIFNNMIGGVSPVAMKQSTGAVYIVAKTMMKIGSQNRGMSWPEKQMLVQDEVVKLLQGQTINGVPADEMLLEFLSRGGIEVTQTAEMVREAGELGTAARQAATQRYGIRGYTYNEEAANKGVAAGRRLVDFILTNRVSGAINDVNQATEFVNRFAAFIQGHKQFGSFDAGMDLARALHFDYRDLSQAEMWVRRFVPFYTWTRNNVPLQFRALMLQPGKIMKVLYAGENIEKAFGEDESWIDMVLPEYAQISGGRVFKFGDQSIFFVDRLPYQDINRMFEVTSGPGGIPKPGVRLREVGNSFGPLITAPIQATMGVDLGTGQRFDPKGTPAPIWARALDQAANFALPGENGLLAKNKDGEPVISEGIASGITELLPLVGTLERIAGTALPAGALVPTAQSDRRLSNALNVLGVSGAAGQAAGTLTPRTMRGEVRRRQTDLSAGIEQAAAALGVDVEWVRSQLDAGVDPETLALMIAAGAGKTGPEVAVPQSLEADKAAALRQMLNDF